MAFTEIKKRNGHKYYYRAYSIRVGSSVTKKRKYLGGDISLFELAKREKRADDEFIVNESLSNIIPIVKSILITHKVKRAGIFGSYAKGKHRKGSDIDILILPPEGIGFGFAGIQSELEHRLGIKVDLVSYNGISKYLKDEIMKSEVRII